MSIFFLQFLDPLLGENLVKFHMKFHFCQNERYEIHTRIGFQTHMRIKSNIQRIHAH